MFLLQMLGEVCPTLGQDSQVRVCAVWYKRGKGGACLLVRWGCNCVYMVCVRAVKKKVRVSVLVAWSSGRSIWLLEISNLLPRLTVQRMYSEPSDSQARWVYCTRAVRLICRCIVKYVGVSRHRAGWPRLLRSSAAWLPDAKKIPSWWKIVEVCLAKFCVGGGEQRRNSDVLFLVYGFKFWLS